MGAVLFALILMIGMIWLALLGMSRKNDGFDERQVEIQRKAYRMGFTIETFYMLGLFIYGTVVGEPPLSWTLLILVGIVLAITPAITYIIWKDAYLKPGQKYLSFGICEIIVGVMNLYTIFTLYRKAPAGEGHRVLPILLADIMCFWIGAICLVKHFINKHTEKSE
jgi:hypothetical protein